MLWLLAIGVPLTVLALVGVSAWLNGVTPVRMASLTQARERLARDDLRFTPAAAEGTLASDGRYALVPSLGGAQLGLVSANGAQLTTRVLPPARLAHLERAGERELRLRLDEPGWPTMRLAFADGAARERWFAILADRGTGDGGGASES